MVVPWWQRLAFARETLESMARQTDGAFECLIVDRDEQGCMELVQRYRGRITLRFVHCDRTDWMSKTNAGFRAAQGRFVGMLHTDDRWHPERVARLREAHAAHPDAGFLFHPVRFVGAEGETLGTWRSPLPAGRLLSSSEVIEHLIVQNFVSCPAPALRRDLVGAGIDARLWYTGDWDLYLRVTSVTRTLYVDRVLADFRLHRTSLTLKGSRDRSEFGAQLDEVLQLHAARVAGREPSTALRLARFSNQVNLALADAFHGHPLRLLQLVPGAVQLSRGDWSRYLSDSRIAERLAARLRLFVPRLGPASSQHGVGAAE